MDFIINGSGFNEDNNLENSIIHRNKDLLSDIGDNYNYIKMENNEEKNMSCSKKSQKTHYIKKNLFPYRYYLCSIFIKNLYVSEKSFF